MIIYVILNIFMHWKQAIDSDFSGDLQEFCRKPRPCRAGMNARVETENQV
jgi:hypothetical protein